MRKVLIVHNPGPLTDTLAEQLRSNYEVQVCHTGDDALSLIGRLRPEVLILYLSLPDIDGITLLQKTTHSPETIIALTNLATEGVLQAASNAGIQDVILIPCSVRYLVNHLEQLERKAPSLEA